MEIHQNLAGGVIFYIRLREIPKEIRCLGQDDLGGIENPKTNSVILPKPMKIRINPLYMANSAKATPRRMIGEAGGTPTS